MCRLLTKRIKKFQNYYQFKGIVNKCSRAFVSELFKKKKKQRTFRDGNEAGRGGTGLKDGVFALNPTLALHCFILLHFCPISHDGKNFLASLSPMGPCKAPPHLVKLYFLFIFPITITIFFNKTCFINKIILKIITKFIPLNQTNFQQKLNNIIQVFNKTTSQQKQKSHSTANNKIEAQSHVEQNKIS